jgi:hypothetical protein
MGERRGSCRVVVGKTEGKRPLGRPTLRWGIIFRWVLGKWAGIGLIWLRLGRGSWLF